MIRGAALRAEVVLPHYPSLLVLPQRSSEARGSPKRPTQLDSLCWIKAVRRLQVMQKSN